MTHAEDRGTGIGRWIGPLRRMSGVGFGFRGRRLRNLSFGFILPVGFCCAAVANAEYIINGQVVGPEQAWALAQGGRPERRYWLAPDGRFGIEGNPYPILQLDVGDPEETSL
jgi:hypothetical protein